MDRRGEGPPGRKGGGTAAKSDTLICCLDPTIHRTQISGQT